MAEAQFIGVKFLDAASKRPSFVSGVARLSSLNLPKSFFRFLLYSGFFASHAAQTAIAHITAFRFKRMPIPVPPQAEQEQIVERIKEIECAKRIVGSHIGFVLSLRASLGETLL